MKKPQKMGVVVTTYNSPDWLRLVLYGYEKQQMQDFVILIADDGSNKATLAVINEFRHRGCLQIEHYWQEDKGFRKTIILNQVIAATDCDYLIFTDGDCIPRSDFTLTHYQYAQIGCFLSGGYFKLCQQVSDKVDLPLIESGDLFSNATLIALGQPYSFKMTKLLKAQWLTRLFNRLTPTKATWNGMNSSGWVDDLKKVNGFDERMQYGGLDRELGERLMNAGIQSKQIRYFAICVHLEHPRGYDRPEIWAKNAQIRAEVKSKKLTWTSYGIERNS